MSILLADMASGLQLAAGLNLASAVLMQTHRQNMERYSDFIAYARDVVGPQAPNDEARDRISQRAAQLEQGLLDARFRPYPILKRLSVLCLVSGTVSTVCLFIPAFCQAYGLPIWSALTLAVGCFLPVVLSLFYVEYIRRTTQRHLEPLKGRLGQTIREELNAS
jgi:hypothetical protein